MEEKLQKIAEDFLNRLKEKLPTEKADKSCIIGIVGMISSGKTSFAKELVNNLKGLVLIPSNGARFLLKQEGLGWSDNLKEVSFYAARWLLQNGYSVIFDGDHVDKEKRENTQKLTDELGAKLHLLHITVSPETVEKRLDEKFSQPHEDSFEDFWVGKDAEKMKLNMRNRLSEHQKIEQEKPEYLAEFNNEGTIEELQQKAIEIAQKIQGQVD